MIRRLVTIALLTVVGLTVGASSRPINVARASPTSTAGAFNYPRLALYDGNRSWGYPLVEDDGVTLNTASLDQVAKYQLVTLEATPFTDVRTDVMAALRQRNPNIKILTYVLPFYVGRSYSEPRYYYQKLWALVNDSSLTDPNAAAGPNNSWLYLQDGSKLDQWYVNINLAKRTDNGDGTYTYPTAVALADLMIQNIVQKTGPDSRPLVDGMFFDGMAYDVAYLDAAYHFDYVRAGYADDQSFRDGWKAAVAVFASRIRQAAGAAFTMSANSGNGTADLYGAYNGWMYENFPLQEGGSWQTNMFWKTGGYYFNETFYRQPPYNFLFSWSSSSTMNDATNIRQARFGLATASMTSGWAMFGNGARGTDSRTGGYRYDLWWYDEYAVDVSTGRSSTSLADSGWLGQPTSGMYQAITSLTTADGVTNPGFEQDATGWRTVLPQYGSLGRDTATAGAGKTSVKLHVDQASSIWYLVSLSTSNATAVSAGHRYAVTFWAKASTSRRVNVVIAPAGQSPYAEQLMPLTTDWQQYQVILTPSASGNVSLRFDLAETAGDVWFDDVHLQEGVSNVYRRDFEHGTVLVNPDSADQSVTLNKPYWTIAGTVDPTTNDGRQVTTVTVKAQDGLFLLDRDLTPPAAVTDLQVSDGAVSWQAGSKTVTVRPAGSSYHGRFFAKRVKFKSGRRSWNIVAPLGRSSSGAVFVYDNRGRLRQTLRLLSLSGFRASIAVQPGTDRVFLAVAPAATATGLAVYRVTTVGLSRLPTITVSRAAGRVLVSFVKISSREYALATMIRGRRSTLAVYQYNGRAKRFVRQPRFDRRRLAVSGDTIRLVR